MVKFKELVGHLKRLPGVGPRQATRFALSLLNRPKEDLANFGRAISSLRDEIRLCKECFNLTENEKCKICLDEKRDHSKICVVEKLTEIEPIEKTGQYDGVYHVLGGVINPSERVLPENLKIKQLLQKTEKNTEVIIATNPGVYGEATALYLEEKLKPLGVKITRLGRGLASGTSLEYADDSTLTHALKNRK